RVRQVDIDIASQRAIFVADHRWTVRERNARHLSERNLCPRWRANQHTAHLVYVVAKVPLIPNIDGISLPPFDVFCNVLSANAGLNRSLHVLNGEAVTSSFCSIDLNVDIKALRHFFSEDRSHLGDP